LTFISYNCVPRLEETTPRQNIVAPYLYTSLCQHLGCPANLTDVTSSVSLKPRSTVHFATWRWYPLQIPHPPIFLIAYESKWRRRVNTRKDEEDRKKLIWSTRMHRAICKHCLLWFSVDTDRKRKFLYCFIGSVQPQGKRIGNKVLIRRAFVRRLFQVTTQKSLFKKLQRQLFYTAVTVKS
jgi:hypothetical protein